MRMRIICNQKYQNMINKQIVESERASEWASTSERVKERNKGTLCGGVLINRSPGHTQNTVMLAPLDMCRRSFNWKIVCIYHILCTMDTLFEEQVNKNNTPRNKQCYKWQIDRVDVVDFIFQFRQNNRYAGKMEFASECFFFLLSFTSHAIAYRRERCAVWIFLERKIHFKVYSFLLFIHIHIEMIGKKFTDSMEISWFWRRKRLDEWKTIGKHLFLRIFFPKQISWKF